MSRLLIDIGNSSVKAAVMADGELRGHVCAAALSASLLEPLLDEWHPASVGLSVVGNPKDLHLLPRHLPTTRVSAAGPLPIAIDYLTPATLGADRIAAAACAHKLAGGEACVVIDAGTCITVDLVDEKAVFRGGAIMPGLDMKFRALHNFTANLPLLSVETILSSPDMLSPDNLLGRSTSQSLQVGVVAATRMALKAMVECHKDRHPRLQVLLTGGYGELFSDAFGVATRYEPNLVLLGIDEIMNYETEN